VTTPTLIKALFQARILGLAAESRMWPADQTRRQCDTPFALLRITSAPSTWCSKDGELPEIGQEFKACALGQALAAVAGAAAVWRFLSAAASITAL